MKQYIIALDQGTTSSRALIFDKQGNIVASAQTELTQFYPQAGWVEHDPMEIWATQMGVMNQVIAKSGIAIESIDSIGITNQRETTIVWDKHTGKPVYNAIVWQCRRTSEQAQNLIEMGYEQEIKEKTGLVVDAYFSATKIQWLLENVAGLRERAEKGDLMFGTVDSWLVYNLSSQKVHVTDVTNASRTMLYNIHTLEWDTQLCALFDIPMSLLPEVKQSSEIYGTVNIQGCDIPIAGIAGDQQAALFGHCAFDAGEAKNTYGTGCFLLMNTGEKAVKSHNGLVTTIAIGIDNHVEYALEGSIFMGGAVLQWFRDEMGLIQNASDSEAMAQSVEDTAGVYMVPAFTGLGAPHWDMYARGSIFGLTRGSRKEHIVRAGLEAIAYQSHDVLKAMEIDAQTKIQSLQVDGGASTNQFLMQFQADILNIPVRRPIISEATALGSAYLAGLATGFFESRSQLKEISQCASEWHPTMTQESIDLKINQWEEAVKRSQFWLDEKVSDAKN